MSVEHETRGRDLAIQRRQNLNGSSRMETRLDTMLYYVYVPIIVGTPESPLETRSPDTLI